MRSILARANRGILRRFARSRVLLAFDFDGTLAPIVPNPAVARMRSSTRRLLKRVAKVYPSVVISGRSRADVESRLKGIPLFAVVGNHGIEMSRAARGHSRQVRQWARLLTLRMSGFPGVAVENKGLSLAVHYRHASRKNAVRSAILETVESLAGAKAVPGKEVLNVLPDDAPDKGTALLALRRRARCKTAIFVGDDDTDEAVFALDLPEQLLGIRVGRRRKTCASYFIERKPRVDDLLALLLALRAEVEPGADRT